MQSSTTYEALCTHARRAHDVAGALSLLSWDQETYMPARAIDGRAAQLGTLAAMHHRMRTQELWPLCDALRQGGQAGLSDEQWRNVQQLHQELSRSLRLPEAFVTQMATTAAAAQHAWEQARAQNDYASFAPYLQQLLDLKHQEAEYYGYESSPYDALLESYEPGMTAAKLDALFEPLQAELTAFIAQLHAAPQVDDSFLYQSIPHDTQWTFCHDLLRGVGYDLDRGRQDISAHPFSIGIHPDDVRITTVVKENDLMAMMYSTLHEFGHALYELGLPAAQRGLPQGEACSLSIHESQSRIWENNLARSPEFVAHWYDRIAALYPDGLKGQDAHSLFRALNKVAPTPVRIFADEVTYHLHVILRYRLERSLVEGSLQVADLPAAWSDTLHELLGIRPANDAEGVLQDVHWSMGSFGYFPTYSLGSLYAAQFWHKAATDLPTLTQDVGTGALAPFRQWLQTQVHSQGRLYDSETLCQRITGEGLNPQYFMDYVRQKFGQVYGIA